MKVTYDNENKLLKLQITEEIDHCMAEKIRNKADFEIQKYMPQKIVMDFGNVSFMDSAGIGMILGRYKTAKLVGGTLNLSNVRPEIKKVLEMSGVLKIIPITED
ncbi:MAG: anti-sigma factor antagonist [Clostridia bacterium]